MVEPRIPDAESDDAALDALDVFGEGAGCWLIATASGSRYVVSGDGDGCATLVRTPDLALNETMDAEWRRAALRRDGATLRVLSAGRLSISDDGETSPVAEVAVGSPAVWVLEPLAEDAAFTTRTTTEVISITPIASPAHSDC